MQIARACLVAAVVLAVGCQLPAGSSPNSGNPGSGSGGGGSGGLDGGGGGGGSGGLDGGGGGGGSGGLDGGGGGGGGGGDGGSPTPPPPPPPPVGQVDGQFPVPPGSPGVPLVPKLQAVQAVADEGRVSITFLPVAGAKDYRIFPLPQAADVAVDGTGMVTVRNATYRCSGDRLARNSVLDSQPGSSSGWTTTMVNGNVAGVTRSASDSTLGYVFVEAGSGRVPVHALGLPGASADDDCGDQIWNASRVKRYSISDTEVAQLLSQGYRDDGIVFYAPAAGDITISTAVSAKSTLYFTGAEATARSSLRPTAAFTAFSTQQPETVPLRRVYYIGGCSDSHDELAAGDGWFERLSTQGNKPLSEVQWSGISAETTFVVEAVDVGCPFQGVIGPQSRPAAGGADPVVTEADLRASAPNGEVFINGQHTATNRPRAIARSFVKIAPRPRAPMDWDAAFSGMTPFNFTVKSAANHGYIDAYLSAPGFDAQFYRVEDRSYTLGVAQGELVAAYADWASDVNGKVRFTPTTLATMSASSYVHATMMTDLWSTGRRYPQLLLSDQPVPVQENLQSGTTLILQSFGPWPFKLQLQLCDHRTWDVNNQCPAFRFERVAFSSAKWPPHPLLGENAAPRQLKRVDLYASTSRAYVFLEGQPYGCAILPAAPAAGPATVTFGDVLYHSAVDESIVPGNTTYPFIKQDLLTQTVRHFDNLGFSSGEPQPAWDETRIPCTGTLDP